MKRLLSILCIFLCTVVMTANNKAVLIGVSVYPEGSGWGRLSSTNDLKILKSTLGDSWDVFAIEDVQATHQGILNALANVAKTSEPGDTIYIHFSGHGQQMIPLSNDSAEPDMLDEAIVPYDARKDWSADYDGSNHLRDDELSLYIDRIREAVGKEGFVLVTLDSCHSDSMDKGIEPDSLPVVYRGTSDVFGKDVTDNLLAKRYRRDTTRIVLSDNSNIAYVSACQSHSKNAEIFHDGEGYGSLSYAVSNSFKKVGLNDIKIFLDEVVYQMDSLVPYQNPGIRTSFEYAAPDDSLPDACNLQQDGSESGSMAIWPLCVIIVALLCLVFIWTKRRK